MEQQRSFLTHKSKRILQQHHIEISDDFNKRQYAVKVRNFHFFVLSYEVYCPQNSLIGVNDLVEWSKLQQDDHFFMKDEMIRFAIQCLYLLRLPIGEIVVQRTKTNGMTVLSVRTLNDINLTQKETRLIEFYKKQQLSAPSTITFGCDIEFMLYNKRTKRYVNAGRLALKKEGAFGIDQAIAIHKLQVYHPIIEMRPKPGKSMKQLHTNLVSLYKQLTNYLQKHPDYVLITKPSINDRYRLGGHIHFGTVPFTFQHVSLLDQLVMIPFSIIEDSSALARRRNYGRLGSVRMNKFQGFEYRSFSSWVHLIPEISPLLNWIEYIMRHAMKITIPEVEGFEVTTYYHRPYDRLTFLSNWYQKYTPFIDAQGLPLMKQFFKLIKISTKTE
ncbi:MAG: hypothetical protein LRY71_12525 [Bacillaceae bacterium]|nr:hypothetical protein [Bacillaceae bacterium]